MVPQSIAQAPAGPSSRSSTQNPLFTDLHDQSEGRKETSEHKCEAIAACKIQDGLSTVFCRAWGWGGIAARRAGCVRAVSASCLRPAGSGSTSRRASATRRRSRGRSRGSARGCAAGMCVWVLGSARVVNTASSLAGRVVGTARGDTLVSILCAFEIWDRLGVAGGAGGLAVAAGALEIEGGLSS